MNCRLIAVLGAGGVGKTTSSASLGLALAAKGYRVAVITVDPAKRLAQVLGLHSLTNEAQAVPLPPGASERGSLHALWLDTAKAVEDIVRTHCGETLQGVLLNHRLFQIVQSQLGGIEEYLGVEKVLQLGHRGLYDFCILDTPPSRHALDFLDSPKHLLRFFDESVLKVFMSLAQAPDSRQSGFFKRLLRSGTDQVLDVFRNFLGRSFLTELGELLTQMKPIYLALKKSSHEIETWVASTQTRFVMVSVAEPYPLKEVSLLEHELDLRNFRQPRLLVLNRVLPTEPLPEPDVLSFQIGAPLAQYWRQKQHQQQQVREQLQKLESRVWVEIPRFSISKLSLEELQSLGTLVLGKLSL